MGSLPNISSSNSKKQNRNFRKCQPFWNNDLASLWKITSQAEKDYTTFKVKICADYKIKNDLCEKI